MEENGRVFNLGQLLNITTGVLYTDMDDIYDILTYLTGKSHYTIGLAIAADEAKPYILEKYPQLEGIGVGRKFPGGKPEVEAFLKIAQEEVGNEFPLEPMTHQKKM